MPSLPPINNASTFRTWRADPASWKGPVMAIARDLGLPTSDPQPFATGTNLVVALDAALILKLFPPIFGKQFISERNSLLQLAGRLDVPIPTIIVDGERDGWSYLVMTRLDGVLGSDAWPLLPERDKEIVLRQIGETIAQVQKAPLGGLIAVEPRWDAFIKAQIAGCRTRHRWLGLHPRYFDELDELIERAATLIPLTRAPVILTGEYIPENFLLTPSSKGWRLAGLIDFGDVMTGWGGYDLLGPSAFMTAGLPRRVMSLMRGFGYSAGDLTPVLSRQLLTLMFLHRASDPIRHICIEDWQEKTSSLIELEHLLWPFQRRAL